MHTPFTLPPGGIRIRIRIRIFMIYQYTVYDTSLMDDAPFFTNIYTIMYHHLVLLRKIISQYCKSFLYQHPYDELLPQIEFHG